MPIRAACLLGAVALTLVMRPAAAQISDDIVKIGVLTDLSGPASDATGQGSVLGAQMAVDDFGGTVAGKKIAVISANHQLKPDIGAEIARRWYDTEQVDVILDVPISAVGLAVQEVARTRQKLFITHSTGTTDFTGKFCSPYGMQWAFDTYALATGTAREVVKRGGDSWFFLTADYAFGHSLERDASIVIAETGGKVLGAVRHPYATPDLSSFILQAQGSHAKIIGIASGRTSRRGTGPSASTPSSTRCRRCGRPGSTPRPRITSTRSRRPAPTSRSRSRRRCARRRSRISSHAMEGCARTG